MLENFATISKPLTDFSKGDQKDIKPMHWALEAFEKIKHQLTTAPKLISPDTNKQFDI